MSMCNCGCSTKAPETVKPAPEDNKAYICMACNTFKTVPGGAAAPECCGKKMNEMD